MPFFRKCRTAITTNKVQVTREKCVLLEMNKIKKKDVMGNDNRKKQIIEIIIYIVLFICIKVIFSCFIILGHVVSESMFPTLDKNDYIIANRFAYEKNGPERGDIIVFDGTIIGEEDECVVKRVIGIPGDEIMFFDGCVYINGQLCEEEYLEADVKTYSYYDYEVPDGCYFVMGDNRELSFDSRYWIDPYVRREDIRGKMIMNIPISKVINSF